MQYRGLSFNLRTVMFTTKDTLTVLSLCFRLPVWIYAMDPGSKIVLPLLHGCIFAGRAILHCFTVNQVCSFDFYFLFTLNSTIIFTHIFYPCFTILFGLLLVFYFSYYFVYDLLIYLCSCHLLLIPLFHVILRTLA